jgi:hypothetical protein
MFQYRLYHLGEDDRIYSPPNHTGFADDEAAIAAARQLTSPHGIEVWTGARFVARVENGDS